MTVDRLWQAVSARDERADGLFVYGVQSTGIYCRPVCPSRRPRRDRVEFFPTPEMAEAHGYRACRRCRPRADRDPGNPADFVGQVCRAVARRPDAPWTSAALAGVGGVSVARLQRGFRRTLGLSPREFVAACRRRRFLDALRGGRQVTEAVYEAGYGSPSRVYESVGAFGMTPATYGRGGAGASVRWATAATRIGRVLVASTDRGLCFVAIGSGERQLQDSLRREFPKARIVPRASVELEPMLRAVRRLTSGGRWPTSLPLDIRATAFQWRVWRALAMIPAGETRSYAAVAADIGTPTAARAVARACATNPVALVVPCHRVVGADGSTGGYRWGPRTKEQLLETELERAAPARRT